MSDRLTTLTVAQVAAKLHRSPKYVRGLIREHKLQAVRLTERGHWLIIASSLAALLGVKLELREREWSPEERRRRALAAMRRLGYVK